MSSFCRILLVGFANSAAGIINEYFDTYFPRVVQVGKELRANSGNPDWRLRFMAQVNLVLSPPVCVCLCVFF